MIRSKKGIILTSSQRTDKILVILEWLINDHMRDISDKETKAFKELIMDRDARLSEDSSKKS